MSAILSDQLQLAERTLAALRERRNQQLQGIDQELAASVAERDRLHLELEAQQRMEREARTRELFDSELIQAAESINSATKQVFSAIARWKQAAKNFSQEAVLVHPALADNALLYRIKTDELPWAIVTPSTPSDIGSVAIFPIHEIVRQNDIPGSWLSNRFNDQPWLNNGGEF